MATTEENVAWLLAYVSGADEKIAGAGGVAEVSADQFDAYDEDTVFYYDRRTFRGRSGIQDFIDLLAPFDISFGDVIDAYGSPDRVTLVINESLVRRSDGVRLDYVRTATYRIQDEVIKECWIIDAPPEALSAYLDESARPAIAGYRERPPEAR